MALKLSAERLGKLSPRLILGPLLLEPDGVCWGHYRGEREYSYNYQWFFVWWHWLYPKRRFFGLEWFHYDGQGYAGIGFWFFKMVWSTPWTRGPQYYGDMRTS